jgi:hypothetical protein
MLCLDLVQELGELLWRKVDILLQWHLACQLLYTDVWYNFGVPNNTPKTDLANSVRSTKDLLKLNKERILMHNSIRTNPRNVIREKSQVKTLLITWIVEVKVLLRNKKIQWLICNQKMKITSRGKTKPNFLSRTRILVKFYHPFQCCQIADIVTLYHAVILTNRYCSAICDLVLSFVK